MTTLNVPAGTVLEADRLLDEGKTIAAIKAVRDATQCSLIDARNWVYYRAGGVSDRPPALLDETTAAEQATTTDPRRAEFTAGLRELADFLDANPSLPLPHTANIMVHPQGTDEEERAAVDLVARILGVQPETSPSGYYRVERDFGGRVTYGAVAIPAATMAQHAALMSYRCAVSP